MASDLRIEARNEPGALAGIGEALGRAGVNVEGGCACTTDGDGILHVLVQEAGTARTALEEAGFAVASEREVLVVADVEDRPGFLGEVARRMADAGVNIDAMYLLTGTRIALVCDDLDRAKQAV